ncbi:MAG TPA: DUF2442 domain-containing protein [Tepidisphaeraceae bacterium]|nr:DUF2442 domain-containing protein [Tepidisphaeraceae bacterium]
MLRRIMKAIPLKDRVLRLEYADGQTVDVDFQPVIRRGGVFATLNRDDVFGAVAVSDDGRSIYWPGELDFCADALWMTGNSAAVADERFAPK